MTSAALRPLLIGLALGVIATPGLTQTSGVQTISNTAPASNGRAAGLRYLSWSGKTERDVSALGRAPSSADGLRRSTILSDVPNAASSTMTASARPSRYSGNTTRGPAPVRDWTATTAAPAPMPVRAVATLPQTEPEPDPAPRPALSARADASSTPRYRSIASDPMATDRRRSQEAPVAVPLAASPVTAPPLLVAPRPVTTGPVSTGPVSTRAVAEYRRPEPTPVQGLQPAPTYAPAQQPMPDLQSQPQNPVQTSDAADPMAPRRDAPIFRMRQTSFPAASLIAPTREEEEAEKTGKTDADRDTARGAGAGAEQSADPRTSSRKGERLDVHAETPQSGATRMYASDAAASREAPRYYSVHRGTGRLPDAPASSVPASDQNAELATANLGPGTTGSGAVDLAAPPADPVVTRTINGRAQVIQTNDDPSLP